MEGIDNKRVTSKQRHIKVNRCPYIYCYPHQNRFFENHRDISHYEPFLLLGRTGINVTIANPRQIGRFYQSALSDQGKVFFPEFTYECSWG